MSTLILVGMGPGHPDLLTREAIDVISSVDRNVAFGRIAKTAAQFAGNVCSINRLDDAVAKIANTGTTALLASGDACFFGILDFLQNRSVQIDRVIPGISSFQYMMNRLQMSWHQASFSSLHGRSPDFRQILNNTTSIVLTDRHNSPDTISKSLYDLGGRGRIHAGFDLSYDSEVIVKKSIGEPIPSHSDLSTIIIEIERPATE